MIAIVMVGALLGAALLVFVPTASAKGDDDDDDDDDDDVKTQHRSKCHTPWAVHVLKYVFIHKDGSTTIYTGSLQRAWDHGKLHQGDKVKVFFKVDKDCEKVKVSLASYATTADHFILADADKQVLVDSQTGWFHGGRHIHMLMVKLPDCFFQIDLVVGPVIKHLSKDNLYGKRKIAWENGGKNPCKPACPVVTPTANQDGSIHLDWAAVPLATSYNIYRGENGGTPTLLDSTTDTEYLDNTAVPGTTYTYIVTGVFNGFESRGCNRVVVTSIPVFPGAIAAVLASLGAVGAMVVARRK